MKRFIFLSVTLLLVFQVQAFGQSSKSEQRALLAYLNVKPGTEQQFLDAARNVIKESRKESGNIVYNLHESVEEPSHFVFYELFRTDADLQYHRKSKHVVDFLKEVNPILLPGQFTLVEYQ